MLDKIIAALLFVFGIFSFGYLKGKNKEKNERIRRSINVVKAVKRRRDDRNNDTIDDIKHRMREDSRDK
jgi:hypothetical protein